jgi:hypothetical protein
MIDSRSEIERAQMFGSSRRYFASLARFLDATPYQDAAVHARIRGAIAGSDVLVSVIIPFWNEVALAVEWSDNSAALHPAKQVLGLSGVVDALEQHPVHRRHRNEIEKLRQAIRAITRIWVANGRRIEAVNTRSDMMEAACPAHSAFPIGANGRAPMTGIV